MHRPLLIGLGIFLVLSCSLKAQDTLLTKLPKQWRLQDCIEYAKNNNISLATLRLTARSAQEDLLQSKAAILPNLDGEVSQTIVNGNNINQVTGSTQGRVRVSSNYQLNSSMILYNGGYLKNDIRSKEFSLQSANLSVKETENNLTLSITQDFFNVLLAKEIVGSFEAVLATSTGQLQQGEERYDAGSIAKKDLLQLQSQVATDQYNLVNANNTLKLDIVDLKQLLLLPSSYDFQVSAPDTVSVQVSLTPLLEAERIAQQTRPEVKNKEVEIKISEVEVEKAKAAVKPTVSTDGALATGYSNSQNAKYVPQLHNNFYQSLGVTMAIPIYSRRVNKTNINKSKIQLEQSRLALIDTRTVLNQQIERAYINLLNAESQYNSAETRFKISSDIYDITNEQLKLGAVNIVELLQIKDAYLQALQTSIQAKYTVALYDKIYEFYMGAPVSF